MLQVNIGQKYLLNGRSVDSVFPTTGSLFSVILFNAYAFISLVLPILLLFGGFTFIMSAGKGDSGSTEKAGKAIGAALAGFAIVFLSYFIIQVVEIITGLSILNVPF